MASASNVINRDALDASLTTFRTVFEELFTSAGNDAVVNAFCAEVSAEGGQTYQAQFQDFLGTWQEFLGAREVSPARVSKLDITLKTYAQSMSIPRKDFQYDKIGTVASRIRTFLSAQKSFKSAILHASVLALNSGAGPIGYDGVTLLGSHPNAPGGGTQSNTAAVGLSPLTFRSGYEAMTSFLRENGEPFNVVPRYLVVGPKNRDIAMEITKADIRGRSVAATGLEAAASVVASAGVSNVQMGLVEPLISERLVGTQDDYWYIIGEGPGGAKPVMYLKGMDPMEQIDTDPNSANVQRTDAFTFGLIADGAFAAGAWPCIYGGIT